MSFIQKRSAFRPVSIDVPTPGPPPVTDMPFRSVATMMAVVAIIGTADSDAQLARVNQQSKIAPLTLPTGDQPPRQDGLRRPFYLSTVGQWPLDLEPRLQQPNDRHVNIAPLTLPTGDQPPRVAFLTVPEFQAIQAPREDWQAQRSTQSLAWLTVQTQVPWGPFRYDIVLSTWQQDATLERQRKIAPLTLVYGDQPIPQAPMSVVETQIITSAPRDDWSAQRSPITSTPWLPRGDQPPIRLIQVGSQSIPLVPREDWTSQRSPVTVTVLLPRGDQPQPQPPLTFTERQAIDSWPKEDWGSQRSVLSLAWVVPPSAYLAPPPFPYQLILSSWPADLEPRLGRPNDQRVKIAPLTLVYGDQPIPQAALNQTDFQVIRSWPQEDWASQRSTISYAAWFIPPSWSPFVPYPYQLVLASWPADLEPQPARRLLERPKTVTLTLPTGDQPPVRGGLSTPVFTIVVLNQIPANGPQSAAPNASWNVPIVVPVVQRPLKDYLDLITRSWPSALEPVLERILVSRPKTAPLTLVYGQQPPPRMPLLLVNRLVIDSWPADLTPRPPEGLLLRPKTVTLTFPKSDPPPRHTIEKMMQVLLSTWPLDLEPRLGPPNERRVKLASLLAHKLSIIEGVGSYAFLIQGEGSYAFLITGEGSYVVRTDGVGSADFVDDI